jgi:DNA-binding NtrC family response regulator
MSASVPKNPSTILVVDDEYIARRVAYRTLTEEGFRVLEAESCAETLEALRNAKGRVELVIIDVVMPECDGVAIGRQILEEWPEQAILYMSAHPAEVLARHGHPTLDVPFLAKPYTRAEILAKVAEALRSLRQRKRVLVVDDEPSIGLSLEKLLIAAGHDVLLAQDGGEALRLYQEHGADLIILDVFMPGTDGLEILSALLARVPRPTIIAMSGGAQGMDLLHEAKLLGAFRTIDKPFTAAQIMSLVAEAIQRSSPIQA